MAAFIADNILYPSNFDYILAITINSTDLFSKTTKVSLQFVLLPIKKTTSDKLLAESTQALDITSKKFSTLLSF